MNYPYVNVKICGIRDMQHLQSAMDAGADYIGFVFAEASPRYITPENAAALCQPFADALRNNACRIVAVMSDPDDALIDEVVQQLAPDMLQLHGHETPQRVEAVAARYAIPVMKALAISGADDLMRIGEYASVADMLLFDAKSTDGRMGGTGHAFDWQLLDGLDIVRPWFLSGGLHVQNVQQAIRATGATYVDVSSGVESSRGIKDSALIHAFIRAAKTAYSQEESQ